MTEQRYQKPPIEPELRGIADLFGWMLAINFERELLEKHSSPLPRPADAVPASFKAAADTLTHETIHFIQALTCGYLYRVACSLFDEVCRVIQQVDRFQPDTTIVLPLQTHSEIPQLFKKLERKTGDLHTKDIPGISPRDLLEGAAYFITERKHCPDLTPPAFLDRLKRQCSFGSLRMYSDAYFLAEFFLGEAAFDVFSAISYIALCSDDPGLAFTGCIRLLGTSGILTSIPRPSAKDLIIRCFAGGMEPIGIPFDIAESGRRHPILTPYLVALRAKFTLLNLVEFAARPYEKDKREIWQFLVPPVTRFSGGIGVASEEIPDFLSCNDENHGWPRILSNMMFVAHYSAICGAALAMLSPAGYHMQCIHEQCPYYRLRLCHAYPVVPERFEECGFVRTFEYTFGRKLSLVKLEGE
jgi:hypothetical protein